MFLQHLNQHEWVGKLQGADYSEMAVQNIHKEIGDDNVRESVQLLLRGICHIPVLRSLIFTTMTELYRSNHEKFPCFRILLNILYNLENDFCEREVGRTKAPGARALLVGTLNPLLQMISQLLDKKFSPGRKLLHFQGGYPVWIKVFVWKSWPVLGKLPFERTVGMN